MATVPFPLGQTSIRRKHTKNDDFRDRRPAWFSMGATLSKLASRVYSKPVSSSLAIFVLYYLFRPRSPRKVVETVAYSTFLSALDGGTVTKVIFPADGNGPYRFFVKDLPDVVHSTMNPHISSALQSQLKKMNIKFSVAALPSSSRIFPVLIATLPFVYLLAMVGILYKIYKDSVGDVGRKVGKKSDGEAARIPRVTFGDVAGIDHAKERVMEVVDFIKNPTKYKRMGARLNKGILLVGPPGTGKTLLARCIASEAQVPFFYCSGSDFVEVFAGRGASRVRSLWKKAQEARPSLLFIDELDALGGARGKGFSGNEEREQTLNQLLACMDGFDTTDSGIVVIGATNRFEILDRALCRPGRFDRVIKVPLPNLQGRAEILKVHLSKKSHGDIDLGLLACKSESFSGAELAHIVNEAAIAAIQNDDPVISQTHLEQCIDEYKESRSAGSTQSNDFDSTAPATQNEINLHDLLRMFDHGLKRTANA